MAPAKIPTGMSGQANPDDRAAAIVERFAARDAHGTPAWLTLGHRFLSDERHRRLRDLLARKLPASPAPAILDVGCGGGHDLSQWLADGWPADRLAGIDLVPMRIEAARTRCPGVDLRVGDGTTLPFADGSFDVATAATVFSSVANREDMAALFAEMQRVTRPGGMVVIYDFVVRHPGNPTVRSMSPRVMAGVFGRRPDGSERLGPFIYVLAAGLAVHPRLGRALAYLLPRTHRLSFWRVGGDPSTAPG